MLRQQLLRQLWRYASTLAGLLFRHPLVGVSIIGLTPNGSIVFVKRQDNGQWALPGGLVDWGETIVQAAARELSEETGFILQTVTRLVGVYSDPCRDPRVHSVCVVLEAKVVAGGAWRDSLEISEVKTVPLAELSLAELPLADFPLGPLSHDHDRQLRDYLNGVTTIA